MKKQIIAFCTALIVLTMSTSSVFAESLADIVKNVPSVKRNVDMDVDADIELKKSSDASYVDGPVTENVPNSTTNVSFDFIATLSMEKVREAFNTYWDAATLLCGDDPALKQELDDMPVTGEFIVTVNTSNIQLPEDQLKADGQMNGFNDQAKAIFKDTNRSVSSNKLVVTVKVKNPDDDTKEYVSGKQLKDNLDTYLGDLTFECKNVSVRGSGTHRVEGTITGYSNIGDYSIISGTEEEPIAKITYNAVQVPETGKTGDKIYENIILQTPTPAPVVTPRPGTSTGGGGGGLLGGGYVAPITPTQTSSPDNPNVTPFPEPVGSMNPSSPAQSSSKLNKEDHFAYIIGYPEGDVRPNGNITRAEVATVFFRLLTDESRKEVWSQQNSYSDVEFSAWYNNAISTMSNAKVIEGYDDGTFRPNAPITRAEFATIAARFADGTYEGDDRFRDITGHWAADYINKANYIGWVNGYEDRSYRPDNNITRAEAMTIVNNVLDRHVDVNGMSDDMKVWSDNMSTDVWYYTAVQEATNSHYFTSSEGTNEVWEGMRETRDWEALEKELSSADSE